MKIHLNFLNGDLQNKMTKSYNWVLAEYEDKKYCRNIHYDNFNCRSPIYYCLGFFFTGSGIFHDFWNYKFTRGKPPTFSSSLVYK